MPGKTDIETPTSIITNPVDSAVEQIATAAVLDDLRTRYEPAAGMETDKDISLVLFPLTPTDVANSMSNVMEISLNMWMARMSLGWTFWLSPLTTMQHKDNAPLTA